MARKELLLRAINVIYIYLKITATTPYVGDKIKFVTINNIVVESIVFPLSFVFLSLLYIYKPFK